MYSILNYGLADHGREFDGNIYIYKLFIMDGDPWKVTSPMNNEEKEEEAVYYIRAINRSLSALKCYNVLNLKG